MTASHPPRPPPLHVSEESPTASLILRRDWSDGPLGPMERWPHNLRTAVSVAVGARMPMVVLWGEEHLQLYNDAYAAILGPKHPAALGRPARECWHELWDTIGPLFESVRRTGRAVWAEDLRLDMLRGGHLEECYFTFSWSPLLGEGDRVDGIFASAVETTLAVLDARRQGVLRALAQVPCDDLSPEQCLHHCMDALAQDPNDLPFAAVYLLDDPGGAARWVAGLGEPGQARAPRTLELSGPSPFAAALHTRAPHRASWPPAAPDGARALVLPLLRPGHPEIAGFLVAGVAERRPLDAPHEHFLAQVAEQVGAALARVHAFARARQERLEVLERMTDGFYALDHQYRITYVNAAAERILQHGREQLLGRTLLEVFPGVRGSRFELEYRRAMRDQVPVRFRAPSLVVPDHWREVHAYPSPQGLSVFFHDATERRLAEQRLQESEERYRSVFELNPLPMWLYDPETLAFLDVNEAALQKYGYSREELLGMTLRDIRPAEELPRLNAGLEVGKPGWRSAGLFVHRRKDGGLMQVEVTVDCLVIAGRTVHLALAQDVTERKQLEAQLRQAQKMEAVGQLAGGIAHDFNNLLAVIGTYTRLVLEDTPAGTQQREDLQEVVGSVERAVGLTRQLLAFSRRQTLLLESVDLNQVVRDAERMLRRVIREDVQLVTRLAPALAPVHADRGQLEQMLVNLVVNARDAMPEGGTLTLETAPHVPGAGDGERAGVYARLVVRDTGHGMDERTRQRIFEPFFTTKPVGKGTGLGLSMVYGVLQQLGGHVEVESAVGQGSTFTLLLPLSSEAQQEEPVSEPSAASSLRGSETVLVVEDDAAVRRSARRLLEQHGYTVLEAEHGQEALALLEVHAGRIHLVLADLVMPVMGGQELVRCVRERWPQLSTLLMSGHDPDTARGAEGFVLKPFVSGGLLRQVRDTLQRRASPAV